MLRGKTKFKCAECDKTFSALDMEFMATAFSAPVKCPKCGSMHTCPEGVSSSEIEVYREIWKKMDENS
jgi:transcription elongation factor Elf1